MTIIRSAMEVKAATLAMMGGSKGCACDIVYSCSDSDHFGHDGGKGSKGSAVTVISRTVTVIGDTVSVKRASRQQ